MTFSCASEGSEMTDTFATTDTLRNDDITDLHYLQQFAISYEFPVVFTEGLFDLENVTLRDALRRLEPTQRHKCVVFLDQGLSVAQPDLIQRIKAYAAHQLKLSP